jgi:mannose-1-phosphate guanylyltransferase/phosphomannomutase
LCNGTRIGEGAAVGEDAVVGDKSWIGEAAVIKPEIKIWPQKAVGSSTIQQSSLIWGKSSNRSLFGAEGIQGIPNMELTPELAGRIAAAYGASLKKGATVSVSCDEHSYCGILKYAIISSLLAIGVRVRDTGTTLVPIARYQCRRSNSTGGIHIRRSGGKNDQKVMIQFFDDEGLPIDKSLERKIENAFLQEDFARPTAKELGSLETTPQISEPYIWEMLSRVDAAAVACRRFKLVVHCESPQVISVIHSLLERLGCRVITVFNGDAMLDSIVLNNQADLGIQFDSSGQAFRLYTETGYLLSEEELLILQSLAAQKDQTAIAIPVTAPSIIEELIEGAGGSVVRTKTVFRSLLEIGKKSPFQVYADGFYSLVSLLEHLSDTGKSLHDLIAELPQFHLNRDEVICPAEAKGKVMRRLMEEVRGQQLELIDGIKVQTNDGWALILPDSEKAVFKVVTQSDSHNKAVELAETYKNKISFFQE